MPATPAQCRTYAQRLRQRATELFPARCQACGARHSLQFAHRRPCGQGPTRGLKARYIDVIRRHAAYKRLCRTCHIAYDRYLTLTARSLLNVS